MTCKYLGGVNAGFQVAIRYGKMKLLVQSPSNHLGSNKTNPDWLDSAMVVDDVESVGIIM